MQVIEFDTVVTDGIIKIPMEYRGRIHQDVKVIILNKDISIEKKKVGNNALTADPIKVEKIILPSREEIHER